MTSVYKSTDKFVVPMIEEALRDNNIAYQVTGMADIGIGTLDAVEILVPEELAKDAREIIGHIINKN